ncbi:hypothetical protein [Pseudomonas sp. BMS12]|uniref:hypothetical protein n=1 Tax=Pseudomonas sp. BMS12 TaxID=1796033 RepID=UPI00083B973A|nr:hypothetical protein [Pseudomonas sp. BMS12]
MKRTALLFAATLITAPAFAADDQCSLNMQKLDDELTTNTTLGEPLKTQVEELKTQAMTAQQAGKTEDCAAASNQALMLLENSEKGGEGGS